MGGRYHSRIMIKICVCMYYRSQRADEQADTCEPTCACAHESRSPCTDTGVKKCIYIYIHTHVHIPYTCVHKRQSNAPKPTKHTHTCTHAQLCAWEPAFSDTPSKIVCDVCDTSCVHAERAASEAGGNQKTVFDVVVGGLGVQVLRLSLPAR
jgi:hypothetical protein